MQLIYSFRKEVDSLTKEFNGSLAVGRTEPGKPLIYEAEEPSSSLFPFYKEI